MSRLVFLSRGGPPCLGPASGVFARPAARASLVATGVFVVIAALAGALRALPVLLSPTVPARIVGVLAREIAGVAFETSLVLGPAIGCALAAGRLVEHGEARALFAVGASPSRIAATAWPVAVAVAILGGLASGAWGTAAAAPGRAVQAMIAEARASCDPLAPAPSVASVPLLEAAWVCWPGQSPRLVGRAAGSDGAWSAHSITVSGDLRSVDGSNLAILLRTSGGPVVTLRARDASLRGLPALSRASNLRPIARASIVATSAVAVAFAASVAALRLRRSSAARAIALGAAGPGASLLVFGALEAQATAPLAYACVPLVGGLAIAAVSATLRSG